MLGDVLSYKKIFRGEIKMEGVGIIKEIDKMGRIVIPKEIRDRCGLNGEIELVLTKDGLLIRPVDYALVKIKENN